MTDKNWHEESFYEARFEVLERILDEKQKQKWRLLPYQKKCAVINCLIKKGTIA